MEAAISWTRQQLRRGESLYVWTVTKQNVRASNVIQALASEPGINHITGRGGAFLSEPGPVLMAWPKAAEIGRFRADNVGQVRALCVINWVSDWVRAWVEDEQPVVLGDSTDWDVRRSRQTD
ncbi:MAG: hypothetical protein EON52_01185 [Actinomycetales bacterium]|nr:MAG: hypothetical protein EON52_01185 [Actinomycetales bacterium]